MKSAAFNRLFDLNLLLIDTYILSNKYQFFHTNIYHIYQLFNFDPYLYPQLNHLMIDFF